MQTNACVDDDKRFRVDSDKLYYRPPQEMRRAFPDCPEALDNTVRIAEQCNVEIPMGRYFFPVYKVDEGKSLADEMCDLARQGLRERLAALPYAVDEKLYWKRLEMELGVIREMDFPAISSSSRTSSTGPSATGSRGPRARLGGGSLVAYALRITNLDPIPYNLLFERFLNIERISMPDIDVDFCERPGARSSVTRPGSTARSPWPRSPPSGP